MEEMEYMEELDTISSMRSIVLKLPYKLREKWRSKAYELQEERNRRVRILDLVHFIEKQARMAADPVFGDLQDLTFLNDMMENNYVEKVPLEELKQPPGKVWFIPHHGVYHPKKRKLRVVFDCSATYQGISLNTELLQGPDLTNSLVGVIMRFRKEPIGFMADINLVSPGQGGQSSCELPAFPVVATR